MKQLWLVRHAKSSWDSADLSDFERPLNERGKKAAPEMGRRLAKRKLKLDRIVTSPARRAFDTAFAIADALDFPVHLLAVEPRIYEASVKTLLDVVATQPEDCERVMLVGHNPGFSELADRLSPDGMDELPTCAVVALKFQVKHWREVARKRADSVYYDYPKKDAD